MYKYFMKRLSIHSIIFASILHAPIHRTVFFKYRQQSLGHETALTLSMYLTRNGHSKLPTNFIFYMHSLCKSKFSEAHKATKSKFTSKELLRWEFFHFHKIYALFFKYLSGRMAQCVKIHERIANLFNERKK